MEEKDEDLLKNRGTAGGTGFPKNLNQWES